MSGGDRVKHNVNVNDLSVESDDKSESEDDMNNDYEDIEAKLQQERIDYLQNLRKRSELLSEFVVFCC